MAAMARNPDPAALGGQRVPDHFGGIGASSAAHRAAESAWPRAQRSALAVGSPSASLPPGRERCRCARVRTGAGFPRTGDSTSPRRAGCPRPAADRTRRSPITTPFMPGRVSYHTAAGKGPVRVARPRPRPRPWRPSCAISFRHSSEKSVEVVVGRWHVTSGAGDPAGHARAPVTSGAPSTGDHTVINIQQSPHHDFWMSGADQSARRAGVPQQ